MTNNGNKKKGNPGEAGQGTPSLKSKASGNNKNKTTNSSGTIPTAPAEGRTRPVRSSAGQGGALHQLTLAANVVGAGLEKSQQKLNAKKHPRDDLDNAPTNMEENPLAPREPAKRRKPRQIDTPDCQKIDPPLKPSAPLPKVKIPNRLIADDLRQTIQPQINSVLEPEVPSQHVMTPAEHPSQARVPNIRIPLLQSLQSNRNPHTYSKAGKDIQQDMEVDDRNDKDKGVQSDEDEEENDDDDENGYGSGEPEGEKSSDEESSEGGEGDERRESEGGPDDYHGHKSRSMDIDMDGPEINHQEQFYGNNNDLEIDEQSPSEDERQAELALHAPHAPHAPRPLSPYEHEHNNNNPNHWGNDEQPDIDDAPDAPDAPEEHIPVDEGPYESPQSLDQDVLQAHHKKNRSNRPPKPKHLANASQRQEQMRASVNDPEIDPVQDEVPASTKTSRSMEDGISRDKDPTHLKFYGSVWQVVLVKSKICYQKHIAVMHTFPTKTQEADFQIAKLILTEQIAAGQEEGLLFETGFAFNNNMATVVFEEGSTFRGKLKGFGRIAVPRHYSKELDPSTDNQAQLEKEIIANAHTLLANTLYLKGGKDDNAQCFYTGDDCLAFHFPELFKDAVPELCMILVMTIITNCIHEYKGFSCGKPGKIAFTGSAYQSTVNALLKHMESINADAYHAQKLLVNRRKWAQEGMQLQVAGEPMINHEVTIDLD